MNPLPRRLAITITGWRDHGLAGRLFDAGAGIPTDPARRRLEELFETPAATPPATAPPMATGPMNIAGTLRAKEALPGRLHLRELLHPGELGGEVRVEPGNRRASCIGNDNRLARLDVANFAFFGVNHHRATRDVKLRAAGLGIAVEHRSPNADGGDSGVDFIGALFGMPRGEAERALRYVDGRLPV